MTNCLKYIKNYQGLFSSMLLIFIIACSGAEKTGEKPEENFKQVFTNSNFHELALMPALPDSSDVVKNVILMIGDGMGPTQVSAGAIANKGKLNLLNFSHSGFSRTSASDNDITDSAAGATAMACGVKTYNGAIGVDSNGKKVPTILEMAEEAGLATGLVATCRITHATPASFIAHQEKRSMYEEIAADFLNTDIDVFIGGGKGNFTNRKDDMDLTESLRENGYSVVSDVDSLLFVKDGKLAGLIDQEDQEPYYLGRGNMLEIATMASLNILSQDPDGFFLMVEGSQIDWGGHDNNTTYMVEEMLDFDRSVGVVLDFANKNPGTLIIVTADHETGGFSIADSDTSSGMIKGAFTTGDHTGIDVPVFAHGPGADLFDGTYDNTEIFFKMKDLLGLE